MMMITAVRTIRSGYFYAITFTGRIAIIFAGRSAIIFAGRNAIIFAGRNAIIFAGRNAVTASRSAVFARGDMHPGWRMA